jgi:hypothetical protein
MLSVSFKFFLLSFHELRFIICLEMSPPFGARENVLDLYSSSNSPTRNKLGEGNSTIIHNVADSYRQLEQTKLLGVVGSCAIIYYV